MASRLPADFPKVNLASALAGVLAIVSVSLPWWGMDSSYLFSTGSVRWYLWGPPFIGGVIGSPAAAQANSTMGLINYLVLALAFITAALAFYGSIKPLKTYLISGFVVAITTLVAYAGGISYVITIMCQGTSPCISGPVGSDVISGTTETWGFEPGFYMFLVAAVIILFGIIFHENFLKREKEPS